MAAPFVYLNNLSPSLRKRKFLCFFAGEVKILCKKRDVQRKKKKNMEKVKEHKILCKIKCGFYSP